jgi:hypothetical protein
LGCDSGARIDDSGIDKESIFHPVQQRVPEGWFALLASKSAIGIEQKTTLVFAGIFAGRGFTVEPFSGNRAGLR